MNLFLLIPAIILLVFGITRGVRRDWRWSCVCLVLGAILFVIHHRQLVASAKIRAREWRITHPESVVQRPQTKTINISNQALEAIGDSGSPQPQR